MQPNVPKTRREQQPKITAAIEDWCCDHIDDACIAPFVTLIVVVIIMMAVISTTNLS